MSTSRREVVITGLGPITGFGLGIDPLWSAMCEGRTAIRRISRFDPSGFPCQIGAELPDELFDVKHVVPKSYRKATKVMARDIELAVGAAAAAVTDAGLVTKAVNSDVPPTIAPDRVGCHIGAGLIAADVDELTAALVTSRAANGEFDLSHWGQAGMTNLTPLWLLKYLPNMLACHVTIIHDCRGPSNTITCAEASAALSVGESLRVIQRGAADACLSGGAEFKLNPMGLLRQVFAGRLAAANGQIDPALVVKPFDPAARGSVLGEGGGIVVLEARETAMVRGAMAYAEIAGFAATQSCCAGTTGLEIDADGQSIADAMEAALASAKVEARLIDAIAPLGSGIAAIDQAEAAAIHRVFGSRAASIPLMTVIPNVGNCCAGASAIPLAVAAKAIREQTLPARINTTGALALDANAAPSRSAKLEHVMVSVCGMGGQNAAIVLRRPRGRALKFEREG
jgi:3-oxoacyl-[acyl-carrier-protein] synthase II